MDMAACRRVGEGEAELTRQAAQLEELRGRCKQAEYQVSHHHGLLFIAIIVIATTVLCPWLHASLRLLLDCIADGVCQVCDFIQCTSAIRSWGGGGTSGLGSRHCYSLYSV